MGRIGVDGALVERTDDDILELNNGCLCCSVRKDLVAGVQKLLKRGGFDYLLIETTGAADPQPVAQTFLNIPQLQQHVMLDSIVTVVDAEQIEKQMAAQETAREQIAMADFVLLNKVDLVDETQLQKVEGIIRGLNPHCSIFRTNQSQTNIKELLDMNAFDLDKKLEVDPAFLDEMRNRHHHDINSFSFTFEKPFVVEKLEYFIQQVSEQERIYRSKGFLSIAGNPRRAIFHGVNNRFTLLWDRLWNKDEQRKSQLVFIGKDLDEAKIRKALEGCLA
jgi:G3E family GTPase